jgi:hypothetical protein
VVERYRYFQTLPQHSYGMTQEKQGKLKYWPRSETDPQHKSKNTVFLVLGCGVQSSAAVDTKNRSSKSESTSKYLCQFSIIALQGSRTSTPKMKAILSSEIYATSYRVTRRHNHEHNTSAK